MYLSLQTRSVRHASFKIEFYVCCKCKYETVSRQSAFTIQWDLVSQYTLSHYAFSSLRDSDLEYKHTLYMISRIRIESLHLHVTWKSCTCWCTEPSLNAVFSCHTEFSSTTLYLYSHKKYVMERSDPFLKRKNNCYRTQYSMQGKLYPVVWHGAWKNVENAHEIS